MKQVLCFAMGFSLFFQAASCAVFQGADAGDAEVEKLFPSTDVESCLACPSTTPGASRYSSVSALLAPSISPSCLETRASDAHASAPVQFTGSTAPGCLPQQPSVRFRHKLMGDRIFDGLNTLLDGMGVHPKSVHIVCCVGSNEQRSYSIGLDYKKCQELAPMDVFSDLERVTYAQIAAYRESFVKQVVAALKDYIKFNETFSSSTITLFIMTSEPRVSRRA